LIIDSNAPLAATATLRFLQPVSRRISQILDRRRKINRLQPVNCNPRNFSPSPAPSGQKDRFGVRIGKGLNNA
jgi:hypothetical protein